VNVEEATGLILCKVEGCENEARSRRGRYAFLCDEHIKDARTVTERVVHIDPLRAKAAPPPALTLVEHAKRLVPAARLLERRVRARRQATAATRSALEQFSEELTRLKDAAEELLRG